MEYNFNDIKDWMKDNNNDPLPPDLDWDNMKDGIFDKIQSVEEEASAQKKRSRKRFGFFIILFFGVGIGLFLITQEGGKDLNTTISSNLPLSEESIKTEGSIKKNNSRNLEKTSSPRQTTLPAAESLKEEASLIENNTLGIDKKTDAPRDLQKTTQTPIEPEETSNEQNLPGKVSEQGLKNTNQKVFKAIQLDSSQNSLTPVAKTIRLPNVLTSMETQVKSIHGASPIRFEKIYGPSSEEQSGVLGDESSSRLRPGKSPDQFILEGGYAFWKEGFGNSLPERASFETPLASFQIQGLYKRNFNRNYFIQAGFQYQQLENKFRYNSTIQDFTVIVPDAIIQVQTNLISGEQTIIRGDVEQSVQAERRVVHYNKSQLFKVSLAAGKSWRFKSFQTDVYLGGAVNTLVQNQGKTILNNTIVDYSGASNALFQNQWAVDGVIGARVHYFLFDQMSLTTGWQAQKSFTNWSNQEAIQVRPISFGLHLGLSYSLSRKKEDIIQR